MREVQGGRWTKGRNKSRKMETLPREGAARGGVGAARGGPSAQARAKGVEGWLREGEEQVHRKELRDRAWGGDREE